MKAAKQARTRSVPGTPTLGQLQSDVQKLARVRDAGRDRLRQLEEVRTFWKLIARG